MQAVEVTTVLSLSVFFLPFDFVELHFIGILDATFFRQFSLSPQINSFVERISRFAFSAHPRSIGTVAHNGHINFLVASLRSRLITCDRNLL